ncbi:serine hydrolase [Haloferax sp. MBLA0076]|uniref:Serine hydrolase n=1 Tax=Haloferax litoreum TaxID=2666140 RepID=A0A6A8GIR6_9EURY|nr:MULTISPECIES: serine hydrolase domain-containing protein [Haloferax]KAB1193512.1 serine hydrolase [Haloferax sp. CBA1148]MRX22027.1 serine hydrolase [Haloferax litoreum]
MTLAPTRLLVVLTLVLAVASTPVLASVAGPTAPPVDYAATSTGPPQIDADSIDTDEFETWLDDTMATQLESYHVPGAAVVLVQDGEVVLAKGYGYADVESEAPIVANETVFGVGSTSKLVTWTAVMQGVEDGRLELDRDVNDYLTESPVTVPPTYPEPITLEHLGTHTAGYEDTFGGTLVDDPSDLRPLGDVLAENQPNRVRPPGESVAYSNYGAGLAGHVVAEEYETTFTDYVEDNIFTPLEMRDSTYDQPVPDRLQPRLSNGYVYQNGEYVAQEPQIWGIAPQGGAMRSTATDMGNFMLAYLDNGQFGSERILEADTVAEMHRKHVVKAPDAPELNGMAYGFIEMDRNDERIVGHWGDTAYFRSLLALYPERDTGLFVVYNSPGGHDARFELLQAFTDRYYPRSETPVVDPPAGAADRAAQLTGDYRSLTVSESSWHRVLGVMTRTVTAGTADNGYLTTQRLGGEQRTWVELRPDVYEEVGGQEKLVFQRDDEGRATHLYFGNFGPATYERVPWYESLLVVEGTLAGGILAFVSMLLLWVGGFVWRRVRGRERPSERERVSRWLLGVTSLLWVATVVIFVLAWLNFNAEVASPSLALRVGRLLPYVALVGTLGAVVATALAWRDSYWTTPVRIHYAVVTLAAVLVAWQLSLLRILPL